MLALMLTLATVRPAAAEDPVQAWVHSVAPPAASIALVQSLPSELGPVPKGLAARLSAHSRHALSTRASELLEAAKTSCQTESKIRFVQDIMPADNPVAVSFLESTIQVISTFCVEAGTAAKALAIYRTKAFRTQVLPLVSDFSTQGDRTCIQTRSVLGGLLAPTSFCHQSTTHEGPDFHGVVGWLTHNAGGSDHQSLYYRHYVVLFVDRPGGGVAGFRGVVTRSGDLNALQRSLIETSSGKALRRLQDNLTQAISNP